MSRLTVLAPPPVATDPTAPPAFPVYDETAAVTFLADRPMTCCPWCGEYLEQAEEQIDVDRWRRLPELFCPACPTRIHLLDDLET